MYEGENTHESFTTSVPGRDPGTTDTSQANPGGKGPTILVAGDFKTSRVGRVDVSYRESDSH